MPTLGTTKAGDLSWEVAVAHQGIDGVRDEARERQLGQPCQATAGGGLGSWGRVLKAITFVWYKSKGIGTLWCVCGYLMVGPS